MFDENDSDYNLYILYYNIVSSLSTNCNNDYEEVKGLACFQLLVNAVEKPILHSEVNILKYYALSLFSIT